MRENEGERQRLLRLHVIHLSATAPRVTRVQHAQLGPMQQGAALERLERSFTFFLLIYKTYEYEGTWTPGFTAFVFSRTS